MILKRFYGNKRYRFRKDIMKIVMGNSYSDANWIERVDGKEVEVITKTRVYAEMEKTDSLSLLDGAKKYTARRNKYARQILWQ